MKRNWMKKGLAFALSAIMVLGVMPSLGAGVMEVQAETTNILPTATQFATKDELMTNYDLNDSTDATVQKVIFGQNGSGVAQEWKIAGKDTVIDGDNIVLFASTPLLLYKMFDSKIESEPYTKTYDSEKGCNYGIANAPVSVNVNHYGMSNLRQMLQSLEKNTSYFSLIEQGLMNDTTIFTNDTLYDVTYTTTDRLYAAYGYIRDYYITVGTNTATQLNSGIRIDLKGQDNDRFWLRSPYVPDNPDFPGNGSAHVVVVKGSACSLKMHVYGDDVSVVPAFNLNLSSVLFASAALSASSAGEVSTKMDGVDNAFTLRYTGTALNSTSAEISKNEKKVKVAGASSGTFLMIQNSNGAYAVDVSGNPLVSASSITIGGTTLESFENCKVWLETTSSDRITEAKEATQGTQDWYTVNITAGTGMTVSSGNASQVIVPSVAITNVVYTANDGYYFPSTYSVSDQNGVSVARDNDGQITVSGTPTDDVNITLTNATAKTYTISTDKSTADFGKVNISSGTYTTPEAQTITITNTGNQSVTLTQPTATNYNVGNLSETTIAPSETATFTVQPKTTLSAGTYNETITVSTDHSTSASVDVSFTVNGAFSVTIDPASATITSGDSQQLTANPIGGSGTYTYQWYAGENTTVLSTEKSYTVSPTTTTTYKVVVSDSIENKDVTATVTVNPITYGVTVNSGTTASSSYVQGATVTITADTVGGKDFDHWEIVSGNPALVSSTSATTTFPMPANAVEVTAIYLDRTVPSITTQPQNQTVTEGQTATFTVVATAVPTPSYQWQVDRNTGSFVDISGANSASYTTSTLDTSANGYKYRCTVSNTVGEVNSAAATLTVNATPVTTYQVTVQNDGHGSASANPSTNVAQGTSITLSATPNTGYQFKEWQVISGSVAITNNAFSMPAGNVTVKAIFEEKATTPPTTPDEPKIGDKTGWDAIKNDVVDKVKDATATSEKITITIDMNGTTQIQGDVIDAIKGKNVDLVIDLGNGIKWTINGNTVTSNDVANIDLGVNVGSTSIPIDVINSITGQKSTIQISLVHNGEFGFTATLSIGLEASNAGYYANLFYYNQSTGKLEFMNAAKIDTLGNAVLTFTHASDYSIVIADKVMDGSEDKPSENQPTNTPTDDKTDTPSAPQTGDNSPILLWILVLLASGFGIGAVASKESKRRKKQA